MIGPQDMFQETRVVIDGMAWLPKSLFSKEGIEALRKKFTIRLKSGGFGNTGPKEIKTYRENDFWFGLPRGYYEKTTKNKYPVEYNVVQRRRVFETELGPRDEQQADCIETMVAHMESKVAIQGMLCAGTGVGKTVMSLLIAGKLGYATMVVVHTDALVEQWRKRILETVGGGLPGVFPNARVGIFKGSKRQFGDDYDIVIASAPTLANRDPDHPIFEWAGLVIADEAHRMGAPTWSQIAPSSKAAKRIGCTATPRRRDGGERLFFDHLGDIVWQGSKPLLSPSVRIVETSFAFSKQYPKWIEDSKIATDLVRNDLIRKELSKAYRSGRKVLLVCKRLQHVLFLKQLISSTDPDATLGMCTGSWFEDEADARKFFRGKSKYQDALKDGSANWLESRLDPKKHKITKKDGEVISVEPKKYTVSKEEFESAQKCDILLAIESKVAEGFDVPSLDTLFIATPTWDIEQLAGRILRLYDGKKTPVITHFVDSRVRKYKAAWEACEKQYIDLGATM